MNRKTDRLIEKTFFHMLPVQILIFAMGYINTLVDGAIAGRFIDASTVGVVGLYCAMVHVLSATGSVLLGGSAVLCGNYMGRGELDKTRGIFSLNLTLTFIIGGILTAASLLFPGQIAVILGANADLQQSLTTYVAGYAIGIIPMLFAQQLGSFLQLERQSTLGYAGIAGMIVSNIVLDILFIVVFRMGILGLALATSFSNIVYFLILLPYYFTKKAQLRYSFKNILWNHTGKLIKIGFPGALLVLCLAFRTTAINRILLTYAGNDGLSAMSCFNMVHGIFISFCIGNGALERILVSVYSGEEDRAAIKQIVKLLFTKALALSCVVGALIWLLAPVLSGAFFPDPASTVYLMTLQLYRVYSFCVPLVLICQIMTNYLQAMRHTAMVNFLSVFDGFFSMVIPAALLTPIMGVMGVWLSFPIGMLLTMLTVPIYIIIYWRRVPRTIDEWLLLKPDFGGRPEDVFSLSVTSMEEVVQTSEAVQKFCLSRNLDRKHSYYSALCLEEMAGNVVRHGFMHDRKRHTVNVVVVRKGEGVLLRIRDDCAPFDPAEMMKMVADSKGVENVGIRLVYGIADEVDYQNLLGLNVLTIKIAA